MRRVFSIAGMLIVAGVATASCSSSERVYLADVVPPAGFGESASGVDASAIEASLPEAVPMCPVTTCSLPHATCASSKFPCDVNLLTDDENCGGCGISCNRNVENKNSKWSCVGGKCVFGCVSGDGSWANCDDDVNNGCETNVRTGNADHCGACNYKCPQSWTCQSGQCFHPCVLVNKPDVCDSICVNLRNDSENCGECGHVCDPNPPNKPPLPPDMHYGCLDYQCDQPICNSDKKANCNGDISDGCEATLGTDEHCTSCADACGPGKTCGKTSLIGGTYKCLCGDGETRCPDSALEGPCRRLDDDPNNCGGCARQCPGRGRPNFEPTCALGVCGGKCVGSYADCDKLDENGCEVNTLVDNRNCGGCGHACAPGQVCSGGTCLVAPCESGAPEATK